MADDGSAKGASKMQGKAAAKPKGKAKNCDKVKLDADWEQYLLADEAHDISVSVLCVLLLYLVGQCLLGKCVCVSVITNFERIWTIPKT